MRRRGHNNQAQPVHWPLPGRSDPGVRSRAARGQPRAACWSAAARGRGCSGRGAGGQQSGDGSQSVGGLRELALLGEYEAERVLQIALLRHALHAAGKHPLDVG